LCDDMPMGLRFAIIGRTVKKQLDDRLREKDLTGVQLGVLTELARLEDSGQAEIKQRDLEEASHVTHPTMTEIIKRLEKKDFIRCNRSDRDARRKLIASTSKTRELLKEMELLGDDVFMELCAGLSEEEISQLKSLTGTVLSNIKDICRKGCDEGLDS